MRKSAFAQVSPGVTPRTRRFCAGREEWLSFVLFVVRGLMLFSALGNFIDPLSNACARRPRPLQPG